MQEGNKYTFIIRFHLPFCDIVIVTEMYNAKTILNRCEIPHSLADLDPKPFFIILILAPVPSSMQNSHHATLSRDAWKSMKAESLFSLCIQAKSYWLWENQCREAILIMRETMYRVTYFKFLIIQAPNTCSKTSSSNKIHHKTDGWFIYSFRSWR